MFSLKLAHFAIYRRYRSVCAVSDYGKRCVKLGSENKTIPHTVRPFSAKLHNEMVYSIDFSCFSRKERVEANMDE